ncbi:MAG: MCE family protein [Actinomycetota bacterium]|nr:MCE family protein [Actinomycetota bacterium]
MIRRIALLIAMATVMSSCAVLGFASACEGTEIIADFEQVGDLVENANVQSSDVEVGTVQKIELDGWNARVTMCVNEEEKIPADARLVVRTTSLLGEKFVDIQAQSAGPPFLEDGALVGTDQTGKASELEEVFAKLAGVLGAGNLEQINRFTSAQAKILRDNAGELREVLSRLNDFTGVLAGRKEEIATSVDNLDSVAQTILGDEAVLEQFLASFAESSQVLNRQKEGLRRLLVTLNEFTNISVRLLDQTEEGLDRQFRDLRPVLETAVANSANVRETLQTLATFAEWFPETAPGDYIQLDVCQAPPDYYGPGTTCENSDQNDDPDRTADADEDGGMSGSSLDPTGSDLEFILRQPLRSAS